MKNGLKNAIYIIKTKRKKLNKKIIDQKGEFRPNLSQS